MANVHLVLKNKSDPLSFGAFSIRMLHSPPLFLDKLFNVNILIMVGLSEKTPIILWIG